MALTPDLVCPPCSGSGRRYPTDEDTPCPMCIGAGEVPLEVLETFWARTLEARARKQAFMIPWTVAQGDPWL